MSKLTHMLPSLLTSDDSLIEELEDSFFRFVMGQKSLQNLERKF